MNKQRRAEIEKAVALLEEAQGILEQAASDEREYFDAMPESLQGSDRGQRADEAASSLETAAENLGDVISEANNALEG